MPRGGVSYRKINSSGQPMLIFEENVSDNTTEFIQKVIDISSKLDIDPDWLMAVMNSESNLNPAARNSITGATGLIQFLPSTATDLGTTTAALQHMSNVEQLDYVYKYFYPYRNYINKFEDLYIITFYPNADAKFAGTLDKSDDWRFPNSVYEANKPLDTTGKGYITIADFKAFIYKKIPAEELDMIKSTSSALVATKKFASRNALPIIGVVAASALIYWGLKTVLSKSK